MPEANHQKDGFSLGRIVKFPQITSDCFKLVFVSFAKPCLLGPSTCLLYLKYTEDSSPNISPMVLLCSYVNSLPVFLTSAGNPLVCGPSLYMSAFQYLSQVFEAQQPSMSVLDPKEKFRQIFLFDHIFFTTDGGPEVKAADTQVIPRGLSFHMVVLFSLFLNLCKHTTRSIVHPIYYLIFYRWLS